MFGAARTDKCKREHWFSRNGAVPHVTQRHTYRTVSRKYFDGSVVFTESCCEIAALVFRHWGCVYGPDFNDLKFSEICKHS